MHSSEYPLFEYEQIVGLAVKIVSKCVFDV